MPLELATLFAMLPGWMLVVTRVAGIVTGLPAFSSADVPAMPKVFATLVISGAVFPGVAATLPADLTWSRAAVGLPGELVLGELIGLSAAGLLHAAQLGGFLASHQSGMTLGGVVNPMFDTESGPIDQAWFYVAGLIYFALDGHLAFAGALLRSFRQVPPLGLGADGGLLEHMVAALTQIVDSALRIAGPATLALLLTTLALGLLGRTMPALNIFTVGFSLKVGVALLVTALSMRASDGLLTDELIRWRSGLGELLAGLARRAAGGG